MSKKRPSWWPECPYPLSELSMTYADYIAVAIPDPKLRMAIRECLMREGWKTAENDIWDSLKYRGSIYDRLKDILLSE